MHGKDERVGVESFYTGLEFYYEFLKALTTPAPAASDARTAGPPHGWAVGRS
jgi:hypothetical protein